MKICSMYGCEARATRPIAEPSIGRIAPAEHREALFAHDALHNALALQARVRLHGQEGHPHPILAGRRESETQPGALPHEELVGNLDEHAGAVSGLRVAAAGAAMGEVHQNLDSLDDDVVRLAAFDIGHEANAAGIAFLAGIV